MTIECSTCFLVADNEQEARAALWTCEDGEWRCGWCNGRKPVSLASDVSKGGHGTEPLTPEDIDAALAGGLPWMDHIAGEVKADLFGEERDD